MDPTISALIDALGLAPHPEGGFYRETWRDASLPRGQGTAIYFLLADTDWTRWHRVDATEIWHHYAGAPVRLESADTSRLWRSELGPAVAAGQRPQQVIAPEQWQRARSLGPWSLVGCTVSPAFEFAGFTLAAPEWQPFADAGEVALLVDEQNREIGAAPRRTVREQNLLHRGVAILVRNSRGEIYAHRRTETKDVFPGLYDVFAGGMVADGESADECALREVAEELGVSGVPLTPLFDHLYQGPHNRSWIRVYQVCWDGPLVHQASEVAWGAFVTPEALDDKLSSWPMVPDGAEIYHRYRASLRGAEEER